MTDKQISRRSFLGNVGKIMIVSPLIHSLLSSKAKADELNWGFLNILNDVGGNAKTVLLAHYDGATDGFDTSFDAERNPALPGSGIYSDIVTHKLRDDYRSTLSNSPFNLKFAYNGDLGSETPNFIQFSFLDSNYKFGSKEILFASDRLPFGSVVDVREAIAKNGGLVPLVNLPAGSYSPSSPYGSGVLTIGTRKLANLNDSGLVDIADLQEFTQDWLYAGRSKADISGQFGIPDGKVDLVDFARFAKDWLK